MQVMNPVLGHTRCLPLLELSLRERMGRHASASRGETTVQFDCAPKSLVTSTHEPGREVRHVSGIPGVVGPPGRRNGRGREKTIAESPQLRVKMQTISRREGKNATGVEGANKKLA